MHRLRRHEGAMGANVAGVGVEVCLDEGRAMRSSPLRRQAQRFGRRHSQPSIEFPCSAPQRDGKFHKTTGNPANVGSNPIVRWTLGLLIPHSTIGSPDNWAAAFLLLLSIAARLR